MAWNQGIKPQKDRKTLLKGNQTMLEKIAHNHKVHELRRAANQKKLNEEREEIREAENKRAAALAEKNRKQKITDNERRRAEYRHGVRSRFDEVTTHVAKNSGFAISGSQPVSSKNTRKTKGKKGKKIAETQRAAPGGDPMNMFSGDLFGGSDGRSSSSSRKKKRDPLDMGFDMRF